MKGFPLPLKLTGGIEIPKTFEAHIKKKSGPEAFPPGRATFEEMQKLRNNLDFNKMQLQLNNEPRLAGDFQVQIIQYIRYVYLVDNFFKNDFPDSKTLKLNFPWTDSFQPRKVKVINHIKYELASCLYNLAICYYTEGIACAAATTSQEKLKGIGKLRAGLWCINEIRQILPSLLVKPDEIPSDLNLSYVNLLHNYFIGLAYVTLMEVMSGDPSRYPPEKLPSVNKAAALHFQIAHDIIASMKPCPIPDAQAKTLKMNLMYYTVMFRSETYSQMAQIHLKKVDEEVRKGHMGIAVSYLRITKMDFDEILKKKGDLDYLNPEQKATLMEKAKAINAKYEDCVLKNKKVYQQPEYTGDQLPEIPDEKSAITPNEPNNIKKKLDDERFFEVFLSPEIIAIKNEFNNYVTVKALEVENSLKNANNVKNKRYADGYVNYLLDLQTQSGEKKAEIPPQLKAKIEKFKKNGGVNAYLFTRKNIEETSSVCGKMIQEIKNLLALEKQDDENLRRQYPGQWTRPYSEQVNQEYVLRLKDLEQKFFIAQNTDKDVLKKFDQYQEWMQKFSMPEEQILTLIPKSSDPDFLAQSKPKLIELAGINSKILDKIDLEKQRNVIQNMKEEFLRTDFLASFAGIHSKTVDKQTEFEKLLGPFKTKLAQVEDQINEAYPLIDQISSQAREMVSGRTNPNQSAVKVLEEMSLAITVINDIFNDFQQGVNFYGNLSFHLNTLQKLVSDFCYAREIEKNSQLQELQVQKNYTNLNAQQPFFQEKSMQFPTGRSVFVPQGQPGQPQGQPQFQGQQNQVTSNYGYPSNQPGQMYNAPQQNQTYTQAYMPQGQGQTQTQAFYPPQGQAQQGNTQTQMYGNQGGMFTANQVTSQMGYVPQKPESQPGNTGGQGQFGSFGNVVESTFVPGPKPQQQGNAGQGQFGGFGNVVESTFIPGPMQGQGNNPYYGQGHK